MPSSSQLYKVFNLSASDRYHGMAGPLLPCAEGDQFVLTCTIRYKSGSMQPRVGIWFQDSSFAFISAILADSVLTQYGWRIAVPVGLAPANAAWFQINTDCEYTIDAPTLTSWSVSEFQIMQNDAAVDTSFSAVDPQAVMTSDLESVQPLYYLNLLTSQYKTRPKFRARTASMLGPMSEAMICAASMDAAFDLDTAVGVQLDVLGQLIGASRTITFQPPGGTAGVIVSLVKRSSGIKYSVGQVLTLLAGNNDAQIQVLSVLQIEHQILGFKVINPGSGYSVANNIATSSGGGFGIGATFDILSVTAVTSAILNDADYRVLLKAKVLQNQWDGRAQSLYAAWQQLFPGGFISIQDNQNMTATVLCVGAFNDVTKALISNGLIVPRPEGVLYNYVFPTLPAFGFGGDHVFVAGFGEGHWA